MENTLPRKNTKQFTLVLNKEFSVIDEKPAPSRRSRNSFIGEAFLSRVHPDYRNEIQHYLDKLKSGGSFKTSILYNLANTAYVYAYVSVTKEKSHLVAEFKKATDFSEPRVITCCKGVADLTDHLHGVYFRADRYGNIIYCAKNISKLLGYSAANLIGISIKRAFFKDKAKYDSVRQSIITAGTTSEADVALKNISDEVVWVKVSSVALNDEHGCYDGVAGYVKDITEQKKNNEELEHLRRLLALKQTEMDSINVSMKYRVQSQVNQGRKAEESLLYHARLTEMGEMVGSIAHQWRQPLSALMFIIEDIRDAYHFGELDLQYLDEAIDECMSYIRFMSDTMDDFRNFFRPEPEKEQFFLMEKLIEVVRMQYGRFEIGAVNVDITCDQSAIGGDSHDVILLEYGKGIKVLRKEINFDSGVIVYGFPNLFKQVILNLLNNAIDAIMEKRVDGILGATEPGRISIRAKATEHRAILEIEDNGVGIDGSIIDKIFEPEYTTKPKNQGTGIGLHMAKSIVEKSLGGKIKAGNGTTGAVFTIELPRVKAPSK